MSVATLIKEHNRLLADLRKASALLGLDRDGSRRAERIQAGARAARAGEQMPTVLNRAAVTLEADALTLALHDVVADLISILGKDRGKVNPDALPIGRVDGAEMVSLVETALIAADLTAAANVAFVESRRAYSVALDKFNNLRGLHIMAGVEPVVASERAKNEMSADELDALWPPGSPGDLQLDGRAVGSTTIGVPA